MVSIGKLEFEPPDEERFPCLRIVKEAFAGGGTAMVVCNAANEIAVDAFLNRKISFTDIPIVIERALSSAKIMEPINLNIVKESDAEARRIATELVISKKF